MRNPSRRYNRPASFVYNLMLGTSFLKRFKLTRHLWNYFWKKSLCYFSGPVLSSIHGQKVLFNYGYTYPLITRQHNTYNAPLIELVHGLFQDKKSGIVIMDIGAAIGDTMLCLLANCPGMISNFYCIDGDDEFFEYLKFNMSSYSNGELVHAFLSSSDGQERGLVKIHKGTASAQGDNIVPSTTVDTLVQNHQPRTLELMKLDVDGFDGKILAGSTKTLNTFKPAIFFEWHPLLCVQTGSDWHEHFEVLINCGYDKFVWFDNYGRFSHFMHGYDLKSIETLAVLFIDKPVSSIAYYDVIALHKDSCVSLDFLARLENSKSRRSWN